jgi:hypothetical protein
MECSVSVLQESPHSLLTFANDGEIPYWRVQHRPAVIERGEGSEELARIGVKYLYVTIIAR